MKILGEKIFARDKEGKLLARIGTLFLKTPGLVTLPGVHAMQRQMWIDELNRGRDIDHPLSMEEEDAELAESVDLIFTDDHVLIRPDPDRMDLAFQADEVLQTMVDKRVIRFLNPSSAKVRKAITERGENWRISRQPISQEDMAELIEHSKVPICETPIYYYNRTTGTRFVTVSSLNEVESFDHVRFRRQITEFVSGLNKRNRRGLPEVDLFPTTTPIEIKKEWKSLDVPMLSDDELKAKVHEIDQAWRVSLPPELRDETPTNYEWRNLMCETITQGAPQNTADTAELVSGIASEFYRQIEWLPGARIVDGEVVFDSLYEMARKTQDPKLLEICDPRVRAFIFNITRVFGDLEYVNIGRIVNSLARHPIPGSRRGHVYIMQYRQRGMTSPKIYIIRMQKWGVSEHLDEGKDMLTAILQSDEYSDYVLDRSLMCRQLGMNLPPRTGYGHFTEKYIGRNEYNGCSVKTVYFMRPYIAGYASDKIPLAKYRNPAFAFKFARLMGKAAAVDLVVGRRSSETKELLFDHNYEIVVLDEQGIPSDIAITSQAGTFVNYEHELEDFVAQYANCVARRRKYVTDYPNFIDHFLVGFQLKLGEMKADYLAHKNAYENLFADRPYDTNGSGAYRWARTLKRLGNLEAGKLTDLLRRAIDKIA